MTNFAALAPQLQMMGGESIAAPTDLITSEEAMSMIGASRKTFYRYAQKLKRYKQGITRRVYFSKAEVKKLADELKGPRQV